MWGHWFYQRLCKSANCIPGSQDQSLPYQHPGSLAACMLLLRDAQTLCWTGPLWCIPEIVHWQTLLISWLLSHRTHPTQEKCKAGPLRHAPEHRQAEIRAVKNWMPLISKKSYVFSTIGLGLENKSTSSSLSRTLISKWAWSKKFCCTCRWWTQGYGITMCGENFDYVPIRILVL